MQELLRRLPKVDQLLEDPAIRELSADHPRSLVLKAVRQTLEEIRQDILSRSDSFDETRLDRTRIISAISDRTEEQARPVFRRVVNATGVVIHTNMGRSLMAAEALEAITTAGRYYSNLEFDLSTGKRGSRYSHVEGLLCELTGAEAALVVNNNAAAVLISLETLAKGKEVIVSRGELVEIGGSFRIPDVMARSGAILVEVGATNKTHLSDYENAIRDETALLLKVHQSNFRIIGFSEQTPTTDIVELARARNLAVMDDLGSGSLIDFSPYGLMKEPTVQESVAAGVDVVTFSGDKLLGGPQAGLILGSKKHIDRIKKNPLNRAIRIDKFTLASLEATLRLYLDEETALARVPTPRLLSMPYDIILRRSARLKRILTAVGHPEMELRFQDGFSRVGGGALPEQGLKTRLVGLRPTRQSVNRLEDWFRSRDVPIIGRIENDVFLLDVRTMHDDDFILVRRALEDFDREGNDS